MDFQNVDIKTAYVDGDLDKLKRIREALMEKLPAGCSLLANPESVRKRVKVDELAQALLPDSVVEVANSYNSNAIAFCSSDNGNCLYNSCSIALVGNESLCHILRQLTTLELLLHTDFYVSCPLFSTPEPYASISDKFMVAIRFDSAAIYSLEKKNFNECIHKEAILNLNNKRWSPMMCMLAISSVIGIDIKSIHPNAESSRYEEMYNFVINPRVYREKYTQLMIMWSRSGNLDNTPRVPFSPNHFVPVLLCKKQIKLKIKQSKLNSTFFKKVNSSDSSKMCDKKSGDHDKKKEPKKAVKDTKSNDDSSSPTLKTRPDLVDTDNNTKGGVTQEKLGGSESSVAPSTSSANGNTRSSGRGNPVTDLRFVEKYDVGLLSKNISALTQAEKLTALKNTWKPNLDFCFPASIESGNRKRKFTQKWYEIYPWVAYSRYLDGAFCKYCVLFGNQEKASGARLTQLVSNPLTLWTSATSKFQSHQKSQFHIHSVQDFDSLKQMADQKSAPIHLTLTNITKDEIAQNRRILNSILKAVLYLARQNIAFRGHRDDSKHVELGRPGNFRALLTLIADNGNDILKKHLERSDKNARYTSKTIENKMIDTCGIILRESLVDEVKKCKFFSVLADEVQDKSNHEQLAINIRYVNQEKQISEVFLTFMHCEEGITGKAVADLILKAVAYYGLNMEDCRGQGYDGAGNMAGRYNGAARLIQNVHKSALYVHCFSHQLNLCIAATSKIMSIDKVMNNVRIISDFFNNSPKRQQLLEKVLMDNHGKQTKLLDVCRTRWVQRLDCLDRFEEMIRSVTKALSIMDRNEDGTWNSDTHTTAGNLKNIVQSFAFIANLVIVQRVLSYSRVITVKLQKMEMDIMKGYRDVTVIRRTVEEIRKNVNHHHKEWYQKIKEIAESLDVNEESPRTCGRQTQRENHPAESAEDYYRRTVTIPVLDHFFNELNTRFSMENVKAIKGFCLIPVIMINMIKADEQSWKNELQAFFDQYSSDLPLLSCWSTEVDVWRRYWTDCFKDKLPDRISTTLKLIDPDMFPNIWTCLKILAVLPITTCSCERTISALGRIKTDLRTTMSQERLNALALLHIHHDIKVDLDTVINRFAVLHPRRMGLLYASKDSEQMLKHETKCNDAQVPSSESKE